MNTVWDNVDQPLTSQICALWNDSNSNHTRTALRVVRFHLTVIGNCSVESETHGTQCTSYVGMSPNVTRPISTVTSSGLPPTQSSHTAVCTALLIRWHQNTTRLPLRPGGPRKTSGFRGYTGACKRSPWLIGTYFKHQCWCFLLLEMWLLGPQKYSGLAIACRILSPPPHINYAVIRPLL